MEFEEEDEKKEEDKEKEEKRRRSGGRGGGVKFLFELFTVLGESLIFLNRRLEEKLALR